MFHYSGDQFWQSKQNLIWTIYSLNEWSSPLLTSLSILPEMRSSTSGRAGYSCQNFLNSIIKTGATEVTPWLLILRVLRSLSTCPDCLETDGSSLLCRLRALGSLRQRHRFWRGENSQLIPRRSISKPLPEMQLGFISVSLWNEPRWGRAQSLLGQIVIVRACWRIPLNKNSREIFEILSFQAPRQMYQLKPWSERAKMCIINQTTTRPGTNGEQ